MQKEKLIARKRIEILFEEAEKIFKKNPSLSNRYIQLARKIAMKVRIRMPKHLKRRFCKHCYSFLKPGINCRVRTKNNKVIYSCFNCKKYTKYPFLKEKHEK